MAHIGICICKQECLKSKYEDFPLDRIRIRRFLAVLLTDVVDAALKKDKQEFRNAIIFVVLNIISIVFFYPASLIVPTF